MYIKASHIGCRKAAVEDFAVAKTGRILGLEDDKFRRLVRFGAMPRPAHFGSGKPAPPKHEKHAVKLDGIPKDSPYDPLTFVQSFRQEHRIPYPRNRTKHESPCCQEYRATLRGDFSLFGEGQAERPAVRRPPPNPKGRLRAVALHPLFRRWESVTAAQNLLRSKQ